MSLSSHKIKQAFNGKLVGDPFMQNIVCDTLSFFPHEIIDYVTQHVWFFSSVEDAWAYTFDGNDLRKSHFIFLSDELFRQDKSQIRYTVAHEIGHVILKHKNSVQRQQSKKEITRQELEADTFVHRYLSLAGI